MTTPPAHIHHAQKCRRAAAPLLRLSWQGAPELWCPSCGRSAPAPDQRTTTRPPSPLDAERATTDRGTPWQP